MSGVNFHGGRLESLAVVYVVRSRGYAAVNHSAARRRSAMRFPTEMLRIALGLRADMPEHCRVCPQACRGFAQAFDRLLVV
jgi:hypothetical protein